MFCKEEPQTPDPRPQTPDPRPQTQDPRQETRADLDPVNARKARQHDRRGILGQAQNYGVSN